MRLATGLVLLLAIVIWLFEPDGANTQQTAGVGLYGLAVLFIAFIFSLRREVSVHVRGGSEITSLSGHRKLYVLLPMIAIGSMLVLFPHDVACAVHLKGYVCS